MKATVSFQCPITGIPFTDNVLHLNLYAVIAWSSPHSALELLLLSGFIQLVPLNREHLRPQLLTRAPDSCHSGDAYTCRLFQFENGIQYALDSTEFSSRFGVNQVTELTVHPRVELILQSEPVVRSTVAEQHSWQTGGVSAGVQGVLLPGHEIQPTVSVSYLRSIYSGPAPDIDMGSANQSAQILVSDDLFGFHVDANGTFNEQVKGVARRAQFGQILSVSHPLINNFTLAGEVWYFTQPFAEQYNRELVDCDLYGLSDLVLRQDSTTASTQLRLDGKHSLALRTCCRIVSGILADHNRRRKQHHKVSRSPNSPADRSGRFLHALLNIDQGLLAHSQETFLRTVEVCDQPQDARKCQRHNQDGQ
jgi:hypothetical protein